MSSAAAARAPGKIAFLFTGQGSQYVNMGRDLASVDALVAGVFEEADRVLEPILGRKLTSYIFVDRQDPQAVEQAEEDLKQTAITQPAVLTMDTAMCRLLGEYGIEPDMVMGHSLGEYGALVAAERADVRRGPRGRGGTGPRDEPGELRRQRRPWRR